MGAPLPTRPRVTPRLELRPFRRRDADALLEAVHDSLPELQRWLPWAHREYSRAEALRYIRDSTAAWAEGRAFDFTIRRLDEPKRHLGNISVWHTARRDHAGEVGYWVRSSETGTGVATEAAARVVAVAFEELGLHRVTLRIGVGNDASEAIANKLGFTREGVLRDELMVQGAWMDHTLYALLEEEYHHHKARYAESGWVSSNT